MAGLDAAWLGDLLMCGKNLQRGKNGLANLASGTSRRVLAACDAGGEEIITRGCGHAPNKPAECRDILVRVARGSGLATEDRLTGSRERHDVEHRVHGLVGEGQLASVKAAQKLHLDRKSTRLNSSHSQISYA